MQRFNLRLRRRRRRTGRAAVVVAAAAAAVLTTGSLTTGEAASAGRPAPTVPKLDWKDCGDGFECATAKVPLDYNHPRSRKISLSLLRLPAGDPAHRIGTLFMNPGGPGGSGVDFVRQFGKMVYPPRVLAHFDVVGFDPRGIGASTPVKCYDSPEEEAAFEANYPAFPVNLREEQLVARKSAELTARCWQRSGWLLPHLGTGNVARDLDLLRQAVGDKKLTYVGYSYGSYLGEVYANLFPNRIRAMIIDGVVDPTRYGSMGRGLLGSLSSLRLGSDVASARGVKQFLEMCASAGEKCAFAAGGDPRTKFATLMNRLRTHAVVAPTPTGTSTVFYAEFIKETIEHGIYFPIAWTRLATKLQDLYLRSEVRDPAEADALHRTGGAPVDEGGVAVMCADTDVPHDSLLWPKIARMAERRAPYAGAYWVYATQVCATWHRQDPDRYLGPWNATTSAPVLVVGNRFDPGTPYDNAVAASRILPDSRLLTLDSPGHTSLFLSSSCISNAVGSYLVDGALPPVGTLCKLDRGPFDPPPTTP
jgi:pimeloyl-ACP methyl ester carboxylesterase